MIVKIAASCKLTGWLLDISPGMGYWLKFSCGPSIYPGRGYWVKVSQSGKLILASAGELVPETRIRILPDGENPPAPPDEEVSHLTSEIPNQFALQQNHPNPFNPSGVFYGIKTW